MLKELLTNGLGRMLLLLLVLTVVKGDYCDPSQSCWPTQHDINQLYEALDPSISRTLEWEAPNPRVCAVPVNSTGEQPLYGLGERSMKPLYQEDIDGPNNLCFQKNGGDFCRASTRNNPLSGYAPAFVVWPTTVGHVQTIIQFANDHNLCVTAAGTGHDFMNRHSCQNSIFVRMSLFKDISFDENDTRGGGDGSITMGPGNVFDEIESFAGKHGRHVASGWANTVGIIGWSIGGGHGPFGNNAGLGVDNILEAQIVIANGTVLTTNDKENADLFWALKGGGGSTWGIITSITVRAHLTPSAGITTATYIWIGSFCQWNELENLVDSYMDWSLTLQSEWSGLGWFAPSRSDAKGTCGGSWYGLLLYVYLGGQDEQFKTDTDSLLSSAPPFPYKNYTTYSNWGDYVTSKDLEPIIPVPWLPPLASSSTGGIPSVLVSREKTSEGTLGKVIKERLEKCKNDDGCPRQELYNDITGNLGSEKTWDPLVSISEGMRTSLFHYVVGSAGTSEADDIYQQLGKNSYFAESAYTMEDGQHRYWGENYEKLLSVKESVDPNQRFWCHHCVGDDFSS